ncbi:MAG: hypothetical protein R6T99_06570 [Bacteroidales bacterium]
MTDKSGNILRWILGLLLAISAILGALFYANVITNDLFMYWGYILVLLTTAITIIAPIIYFLFNIRNALKFLIMLGILVVLGIIAYSISGNEFSALKLEEMEISADTSKWVGAGLIFTYILAGLTILSIVYSSISRLFK